MSRGHCIRQRQILDYLQEHLAADIRSIVADIEGCDRWEIAEAIIKSYQRACRKLRSEGSIVFVRNVRETRPRRDPNYPHWDGGIRDVSSPRWALSENLTNACIETIKADIRKYQKQLDSPDNWWRENALRDIRSSQAQLARLEAGEDPEKLRQERLSGFIANLRKAVG